MNDSKSADESPRTEVAKKVITAKQKYYFPDHGVVVEAEDAVEADKKRKAKKTKNVKEGDV